MHERTVQVVAPGEGLYLPWGLSEVRYLTQGKDTQNSYCLSVGSVPPGGGAPPHSHLFDEGFYVLSGEMTFVAGNRTVTLGKGGFLQIRGGTAHRTQNASNADANLLVIAAPAGFDEFQVRSGSHNLQDWHNRMTESAPEFGINLDPPQSAFEVDPEIVVRHPGEGRLIAAAGDLYRFLALGEETDRRYSIWHAVVPSGSGPPPHVHSREEEGFYVLTGEVTFHADGVSLTARAGTFLNLPKGSRHFFRNDSLTDAEMLILVAPAGLEAMFYRTGQEYNPANGPIPKMSPEEIEKLLRIAPEYGIEIHH